MDLDKYRLLLEILNAGSLSQAAENTSYSVSGLSRMVASLETELGFTLLSRGREGVNATDELRRLLPIIQKLLHQEDIFDQTVADIQGLQVGRVRIGVVYNSYYSWLSDCAEEFRLAHSGVEFKFQNGHSSDLLEELNNHKLDFCLMTRSSGDYAWIPIGEEEFVAWLPTNHPLATRSSLALNDLEGEPYVGIYEGKDIPSRRIFEQNNIKIDAKLYTDDSFAVYSMVEAGLGVSMNHRSTCSKWSGSVAVIPFEPPIYVPIGFAYRKDITPVAKAFLDTLVNDMKEMSSDNIS